MWWLPGDEASQSINLTLGDRHLRHHFLPGEGLLNKGRLGVVFIHLIGARLAEVPRLTAPILEMCPYRSVLSPKSLIFSRKTPIIPLTNDGQHRLY